MHRERRRLDATWPKVAALLATVFTLALGGSLGGNSRQASAANGVVFAPLVFVPPRFAPLNVARASVHTNGAQANAASDHAPAMSADGRWVAFSSLADNLVSRDTNDARDIFVHNRVTGETSRVSENSSGAQGDDDSELGAISADGRYVAYTSCASNLTSSAECGFTAIYLRDRQSRKTSLISVSSSGDEGNATSRDPAISADGRYVAFSSESDNLVSGDINEIEDVFVRDRQDHETTRLTTTERSDPDEEYSGSPVISADGRYVAFTSYMWVVDLIPGDDNGAEDVFVYDRQSGEIAWVSVNSSGEQGNQGSFCDAISADGRYIAFTSVATNLVADDTNDKSDVFIRDMQTGQTARVSLSSGGAEANDDCWGVSLSSDGRYVAFSSWATNLVRGDTNNVTDILVHDRQTGLTVRASVSTQGEQANSWSDYPAMSADGRYLAFVSEASNLVADDTNEVSDVFVVTLRE